MLNTVTTQGLAYWTYWLITAIYFITIVSCIAVVLSENRNPIKSLAWVIVLIFLPFVGLIFYLFFGRSVKTQHRIWRSRKRKLANSRSARLTNFRQLDLSDTNKQIVKIVDNVAKAPFCQRNEIDIFTDGHSKFDSLKADLLAAGKSILLQYYIFADDQIGSQIADILIAKAAEGVDVRVIYDHVGSFSTSKKFFNRLSDNGVKVHPFFRVTFPQLASRLNWRNHRKIVVIDSRIGYIGGMNIADRYLSGSPSEPQWRDTHFRLRGDIVSSLGLSFANDWSFMSGPLDCPVEEDFDEPVSAAHGVQLLTSGPADAWPNIEMVFIKAISSAKKSIFIQTPYFVPTDPLLKALQAAALARVDVRIMLPRKSDSKLLNYASFSYINQCLKAGIKVYLYEPGMLHAKAMIIDDDLVTAGSTNFDFRSFEHNFEANLFVYGTDVNRRMRDIFFHDLALSSKLTRQRWNKRPLIQKFAESILRLLAPIL